MKRIVFLFALCVLCWMALPSGASAQTTGSKPKVELGESTSAIPPAPAAAGKEPAPAANENVAPGAQKETETALAQKYLQEGRFELAVQSASRAIVQNPDDPIAKAVRAYAYAAMGRFEEALADQTPLEATLPVPLAELKSANDVVAVVTQGTKLLIEKVEGDWLKVTAAGDKQFKWAWIHKRNLVVPVASLAQPPVGVQGLGPGREMQHPRRRYFQYYGPRYPSYGREYYDWWRNVPPQYWRYLPR